MLNNFVKKSIVRLLEISLLLLVGDGIMSFPLKNFNVDPTAERGDFFQKIFNLSWSLPFLLYLLTFPPYSCPYLW